MSKNKTNWGKVAFWVFTYLAFVSVGFILGMVFQQTIIVQSVIGFLGSSNLDITINFNETKFVEEFNKTVVPTIKETLNKRSKGE